MATEPVTIFAHGIDPESVLQVARRVAPKVKITQSGGSWSEIVAQYPRGMFRKPLTLRLTHDPNYYLGEGWLSQRAGMIGYFSGFPIKGERRRQVMATIMSFQFCVGSIAEPDFILSGIDPRLDLLSAIVSEIDGCMFMPSGLRDAAGRTLIDADGSFDPEAVFPSIPNQSEDADDDGFDPEPPDANRVARRAIVLAAVAARGVLEMQWHQGHTEVADNLPRIRKWIEELNLRGECEPIEWERIVTPVEEMSQQAMIDCIWRLEGLGVLAWVLELFDLPRYDVLVEIDDVLGAVGFLSQEAPAFLTNPQMRGQKELNQLAEQILACHWRLRDFSLRPIAIDFREFGKNCWFGPISTDWAEIVDGDLALEGTPIVSASEEVWSRCSSCAMERHMAINWLLGQSVVYSEADTST